jgi:hypothetical protein
MENLVMHKRIFYKACTVMNAKSLCPDQKFKIISILFYVRTHDLLNLVFILIILL